MPLITDSLTIPPAGSLNGTGKSAAARQLPAAASRSVVPLVYGEDRISGLILNVLGAAYTPGTLVVQVLWCHACDSINDVLLNDQPLPAGAGIAHYTGSQTTVPITLEDAFAAQGITGVRPLTGYAWSMLILPTALFDGQLSITARVRGRRCYDPAFDSTAGGSGPQRLADASTWAYTDCPAVCLGDFLASTVYGCGVAVDWASVRTTGGSNRAIVPGSSEQRRLLGVSFTSTASATDVADTLRAYAGCFLLPGPSGVKLLPDANDAAVASYRHSLGQIAAIDALDLRDLNQAPTAVEVIYTDRSATPWRDASAIAQLDGAGTTKPWRLSQVRLPGVHRYGQALREAAERLNKLNLNNLSTTLEVFDVGIRHELGDIIEVEHPIGLTLTPMRISSPPSMPSPGRWRLPLVRHSAAAYSDVVVSAAAVQDSVRVVGSKLSDAEILAAIDAGQVARPNLLAYGGFEKGLVGWSGSLIGSFSPSVSLGWGRFVISGSIASGTGFLQHAAVSVSAGEWYTVHGDIVLLAASGAAYFDVQFLDGGGTPLLDGPQNARSAPFDFSTDDATRRIVAVEAQAPAGAVSAVVRFVWSSLVSCTAIGARLVKLERGRLPYSAYSNEAAVLQAAADATAAQSSADSANAQLADIASDSVLSPGEKPAVLLDYNTLIAEQASLDAQADTYFIISEKAAYDAALAALTSYLGGLTGWNVIPGSGVAIVGATFRAKFGDVYATRQTLLARITALTAARLATRRNLLPNGGFETGDTGWVLGSSGLSVTDGVWGRTLQRGGSFSGTGAINSASFPVTPGETYTITGDSLLFATSGQVSFDLIFYSSGGTLLLDGPNAPIAATHDFSNGDGQRTAHAVQCVAPAGSAYAVARFVWESVVGGTAMGCRQIKVERGALPATPYSPDAALLAIYSSAAAAQANATSALGTLATMRSNGYLDASEKPLIMKQWQAISDEYTGIASQGSAYGLGSLTTAYNGAASALSSYLASLSPAWNDTTVDTPITPATDQATWAAYYSARQTLLNAIADEAAKRAQWAQVSGSGKPADNATKNVLTYSPTAPGSPTDGDIWIDTSVTPRTIRMRLGGTWQLASTYVNGTAQITDDANLGLTALWSGVAGSGKPADNATRNQVYFQDTDPVSSPGGVVDGAIWVSSTKAWQRVGGAWRPYVGTGSVNTGELADGAATGVATVVLETISFSNIA